MAKEKRILLADASVTMLEMHTQILDALKQDLYTARTGAQLLDIVEKYDPDLIVMDLVLPEGDGIHVLKKLRMSEKPMPKVVVLTALNGEALESRVKALGVDAILHKPLHPEELCETVKGLL